MEMNEQIPESLLAKIQKIINFRDSSEAIGNMPQYEVAAMKLQKLLMEHNLSEDQVTASQIDHKAGMENIMVDLTDKQDKRESDWVWRLYYAIAEANLCKIDLWGPGNQINQVRVFGHKINVQVTLYVCEQMLAKIRIAEREAFRMYTGEEKRGTFRRGFLKGCVHGIGTQLRKQKREQQYVHNPLAVMIVNKEKEVQEAWDALNGNSPAELERRKKAYDDWWNSLSQEGRDRLEKQKARALKKAAKRKGPRGISSEDGYLKGLETGQKMSINKGIED